jgi:phosphatidate cytidylyltransferase
LKEILVRAATGLVFITVLIGAIVWNKYSVAALFFVVAMLGLFEFFKLMEKGGFKPKKTAGIIVGSLVYLIISLYSITTEVTFAYLLFIFPLLVLLVVLELFRKSEYPVTNFAFSVMGIVYVVIPLSMLNFFVAYDNAAYYETVEIEGYKYLLLLAFFVIQWANDTGAYVSGKAFGKHKLFERISPNKTWEGAIGGGLFALVAGFIFAYTTDSNLLHWSIISLLIVVFGTLGDLTESQIKRSVGVKDSGNILPGHGGILDRFDGVLFSAPFVLTYLHLFEIHLNIF